PGAFSRARDALDLARPGRTLPALVDVARLLRALCPAPRLSPCFDGPFGSSAAVTAALRERLPASNDAVQVIAGDGDLAQAWMVAMERTDRAIVLATGIAVEATASREVWAVGESVPVAVR